MYFNISKLVKQNPKHYPPFYLFLVAIIKTPSISQRKSEHKAKEVFDLLRELTPWGNKTEKNTDLPLQQSAFRNPQVIKILAEDPPPNESS